MKLHNAAVYRERAAKRKDFEGRDEIKEIMAAHYQNRLNMV
jgi:hypothetical protein